jgi:hypothetical protein
VAQQPFTAIQRTSALGLTLPPLAHSFQYSWVEWLLCRNRTEQFTTAAKVRSPPFEAAIALCDLQKNGLDRTLVADIRRFAGIELGDDRNPDETTILNFRYLLQRHGLTEALFAEVKAHLADKGITLRSGTLVDATIIDAPSLTKNKSKARDPEMSSTKKGNDWFFDIKAHIGVDAEGGVTYSLENSTAGPQDNQV